MFAVARIFCESSQFSALSPSALNLLAHWYDLFMFFAYPRFEELAILTYKYVVSGGLYASIITSIDENVRGVKLYFCAILNL